MDRIVKKRKPNKMIKINKNSNHFSAKEIFKIVKETRDFEIEMFWKRTNYFLLLNSAVGAALLLSLDNLCSDTYKIMLIFSVIGFVVCLAWFCIGLGGKYWQSHWEQLLIDIQKDVGLEGRDIFGDDEKTRDDRVRRSLEGKNCIYRRLVLWKPSVSRSMHRTAFFFLLVWLSVFLFSIPNTDILPWLKMLQIDSQSHSLQFHSLPSVSFDS